MPNFNPFDVDFDGDVDGIDSLGFNYLTRCVLRSDGDEQDDDERSASWSDDQWDDDDETEDY